MSSEGNKKKQVVIVGAGTGGILVASQLLRKRYKDVDVTLVDPSTNHYYQPGWTLVGADIFPFSWSERKMKDVVPSGAKLIQDAVSTFHPENNTVKLSAAAGGEGKVLPYDYLVVAAGLEMDWKFAPGVEENVMKPSSWVVSNYTGGGETADALKRFPSGGTALFHVHNGAIKCGGAPLKAAFLSYDYWKNTASPAKKAYIEFITGMPKVFGVPHYVEAIEGYFAARGIATHTETVLKEIKVPAPEGTPAPADKDVPPFNGLAILEDKKKPEGDAGRLIQKPFHMMHVVPPMCSPAFIRQSPLAAADGYVAVDAKTLQSTKFPNVFSLGDCAGCPTSKTAAAAIAQAPVLVHNMQQHMDGKSKLTGVYDGYTSCPLVLGRNPPELLLAEFDYDKKPKETFPWDQRIGTGLRGRLNYFIKEQVFPRVYWSLALSGRWFGSNTVFEPKMPSE